MRHLLRKSCPLNRTPSPSPLPPHVMGCLLEASCTLLPYLHQYTHLRHLSSLPHPHRRHSHILTPHNISHHRVWCILKGTSLQLPHLVPPALWTLSLPLCLHQNQCHQLNTQLQAALTNLLQYLVLVGGPNLLQYLVLVKLPGGPRGADSPLALLASSYKLS